MELILAKYSVLPELFVVFFIIEAKKLQIIQIGLGPSVFDLHA